MIWFEERKEEEMLDDPRVMHGDASGDIITTVAQRCHEVSL